MREIVLVCGSREWTDYTIIERELRALPTEPPSLIIHGAAQGADSIAGEIAEHLGITVIAFPARWKRFGKGAGMRRNKEMLDFGPTQVLAFPKADSKGTWDMVRRAETAGVPVKVVTE